MGADGRITSQGTPSETLLQDQALVEEIKHEEETLELEDDLKIDDEDATARKASAKGAKVPCRSHSDSPLTPSLQLVLAEETERGHISWKAALLLLGELSPWPLAFWIAYIFGRWYVHCKELCPNRSKL
jgi:hypothetical protein